MLLNLYRYPAPARDDLLTILKKIRARLWMPHQAALEYQENRLGVIAEQKRKYREVSGILEKILGQLDELRDLKVKKRHSAIDPDRLIEQTRPPFDQFLEELRKLEEGQPDVHSDDITRDEIDALLEGRIGSAPESQETLDAIYKDGEKRYGEGRPPGFRDRKEKSKEPPYLHGGLVYRREYGDWVLWKQIIEQAQTHDDFRKIILVTDDRKEDWWWTYNSQGPKTIGPRPELVEEIRSSAGVTHFFMYNSERFIEYAADYLSIRVGEESISQVRDVIRTPVILRGPRTPVLRQPAAGRIPGLAMYQAFLEWLQLLYPDDKIAENERGYPDLIRMDHVTDKLLGYDLKAIRSPEHLQRRYGEWIDRALSRLDETGLDRLEIVLATDDASILGLVDAWLSRERPSLPRKLSVSLGLVEMDEDGGDARFTPFPKLSL